MVTASRCAESAHVSFAAECTETNDHLRCCCFDIIIQRAKKEALPPLPAVVDTIITEQREDYGVVEVVFVDFLKRDACDDDGVPIDPFPRVRTDRH